MVEIRGSRWTPQSNPYGSQSMCLARPSPTILSAVALPRPVTTIRRTTDSYPKAVASLGFAQKDAIRSFRKPGNTQTLSME